MASTIKKLLKMTWLTEFSTATTVILGEILVASIIRKVVPSAAPWQSEYNTRLGQVCEIHMIRILSTTTYLTYIRPYDFCVLQIHQHRGVGHPATDICADVVQSCCHTKDVTVGANQDG